VALLYVFGVVNFFIRHKLLEFLLGLLHLLAHLLLLVNSLVKLGFVFGHRWRLHSCALLLSLFFIFLLNFVLLLAVFLQLSKIHWLANLFYHS